MLKFLATISGERLTALLGFIIILVWVFCATFTETLNNKAINMESYTTCITKIPYATASYINDDTETEVMNKCIEIAKNSQ